MIAGFFLILGTFLGWVFNYINDLRRERREDRTKWRDVIRDLGAELITTADAIWELEKERAHCVGQGLKETSSHRSKVEAELCDLRNVMRGKANQMKLLAP